MPVFIALNGLELHCGYPLSVNEALIIMGRANCNKDKKRSWPWNQNPRKGQVAKYTQVKYSGLKCDDYFLTSLPAISSYENYYRRQNLYQDRVMLLIQIRGNCFVFYSLSGNWKSEWAETDLSPSFPVFKARYYLSDIFYLACNIQNTLSSLKVVWENAVKWLF